MANSYTHCIEVYQRADGKFDVRIKSRNGNILYASSQGYENREDAKAVLNNFLDAVKHDAVTIA